MRCSPIPLFAPEEVDKKIMSFLLWKELAAVLTCGSPYLKFGIDELGFEKEYRAPIQIPADVVRMMRSDSNGLYQPIHCRGPALWTTQYTCINALNLELSLVYGAWSGPLAH